MHYPIINFTNTTFITPTNRHTTQFADQAMSERIAYRYLRCISAFKYFLTSFYC